MTSVAFKESNPKSSAALAKLSMSCVSQLVMMEVAVAMGEGHIKYGRHNYREEGVLYSTYYDATRRHLDWFWEGEDIDLMSGIHHVTKAITSLTVLRDAMIMGMAIDDRPPTMSPDKFKAFIANLEFQHQENLKRYADRNPKHVTGANVDKDRVAECMAEAERVKEARNANSQKASS